MEYMAQEPPAHRLSLLLHRPIGSKEHSRPKCSGPSLKEAQNTHWGAFDLLGRKLRITQDNQIRACKATGRKWQKNRSLRHFDALGIREAFGTPMPSATQGPRLRGSLRLAAQSSKIPFGDKQPPHLMQRHIHPPHSMWCTCDCQCHPIEVTPRPLDYSHVYSHRIYYYYK
ncbi:unnamed protein product [Cuscuta epithymum]|uniref:Uncharacterized protein n=1 Tax=Cuscuta epithymum TaxID=186058 RepID=A0AAV0CCG3_9ASTE|nr:unnamed protein product [Cuscuta epithymum]